MLKRPLIAAKPGESTAAFSARLSAYVRNTLLASPEFPRLYADVVLSSAPNSNEAKILAPHYKKIVERTNANIARANLDQTKREAKPTTKKETMSTAKICTHIKVTGVRCGSPALRGEQFCYFHQRMIRTVKGPPASRVHHAALLEDEESIQASLMEVVNALLRGSIEVKRAELILRALNTAVRNIRRVNFSRVSRMVTQLPDYPAVPDLEVEEAARAEAARQATRAEIARVRAEHLAPANVQTPATTELCGNRSQTRPGGPESPGLSALHVKSSPTPPAEPTRRKPPQSVKLREAPKERKITAHGASRG